MPRAANLLGRRARLLALVFMLLLPGCAALESREVFSVCSVAGAVLSGDPVIWTLAVVANMVVWDLHVEGQQVLNAVACGYAVFQ